MPRKAGTPFRKTQARVAIEGLVRALSPCMQLDDALREVIEELAYDGELWAELELERHPVEVVGEPSMPPPLALLGPTR